MSTPKLPDHTPPLTALVVEADDRSGTALEATLAAAGFGVARADNFHHGKALLMAGAPLVLVAAVRLGAFNGLQLAVRASALEPRPAVVITCPVPDTVLQLDAERLGATFVAGPVASNELMAAVYRTLRTAPHEPIRPPFERRESDRRTIEKLVTVERRHHERRREVVELVARAAVLT